MPFSSSSTDLEVRKPVTYWGMSSNGTLVAADALKSLLIVERTPSPDPEAVPGIDFDLDLDNLSAVQKTQLKEFLRGLAV